MSVIDNKGRLFGKINLLDLVVVVAVIAVAGRYGYKHFMPKQSAVTGQDQNVEIVVKISKISQSTVDGLKVGDEILDSPSNTILGKVVKKEAQPSPVPGATSEYPSKELNDMYVTISGPGRVSPDGAVSMAGIQMLRGRAESLRTVSWTSSGYVTGLPGR
ncbi:MAG TPA: DUF4330 domain-containing protein [Symbiobacteriaceae bacterium]